MEADRAEATDAVEAILERLRARGGRVTSQRRAIITALFAEEHHLTADRIAEKDSNLRDWCWVGPDAEAVLTKGLEAVLRPAT